jgi:oxalyl-CoA decarboxylase
MKSARYEKLIEAFGGTWQYVTNPQSLRRLSRTLWPRENRRSSAVVIDPRAGTESGNLQNLNPQSAITNIKN